jgi:Sap, sulfolipid-1-addressing protein
MLGQAAGFAVLSAITPLALVVAAVYLESAKPRQALLLFLAGAIAMTVALGIAIVIVVHAGGLDHPHQRQPRYGLRLGLGVLALGVGLFVARRKPKPPTPDKKPGLITRMLTHPRPITAFLVGMLVFLPGVSFLAAVQVIGTARASDTRIGVALGVVVVIDLAFAWLPLVLYLIAPDVATRGVKALNQWLEAHERIVTVTVLVIVGVLLIVNGAAGLST